MIASRLRRHAILYETGRHIIILTGQGALRTPVRVKCHPRAWTSRAHWRDAASGRLLVEGPRAPPLPYRRDLRLVLSHPGREHPTTHGYRAPAA